jgi:A/G-specific adenine glycosylase
MDLGATICTPRNPACGLCPLSEGCIAFAAGIAATLPRRSPKPEKPVRFGIAYVARRADGALLLERRAEKGLLGGMLGFPGSDWSADPGAAPPLEAEWSDAGAEVRHTFTHFHLRLTVLTADVAGDARPERGEFVAAKEFRPGDLPTLMRKVHAVARNVTAKAD